MLSYMQVYLIPPYQVTPAVVNYLQTCMFHATLCMFISIKPASLNYILLHHQVTYVSCEICKPTPRSVVHLFLIMMDTFDSSVADLGNLVHF